MKVALGNRWRRAKRPIDFSVSPTPGCWLICTYWCVWTEQGFDHIFVALFCLFPIHFVSSLSLSRDRGYMTESFLKKEKKSARCSECS